MRGSRQMSASRIEQEKQARAQFSLSGWQHAHPCSRAEKQRRHGPLRLESRKRGLGEIDQIFQILGSLQRAKWKRAGTAETDIVWSLSQICERQLVFVAPTSLRHWLTERRHPGARGARSMLPLVAENARTRRPSIDCKNHVEIAISTANKACLGCSLTHQAVVEFGHCSAEHGRTGDDQQQGRFHSCFQSQHSCKCKNVSDIDRIRRMTFVMPQPIDDFWGSEPIAAFTASLQHHRESTIYINCWQTGKGSAAGLRSEHSKAFSGSQRLENAADARKLHIADRTQHMYSPHGATNRVGTRLPSEFFSRTACCQVSISSAMPYLEECCRLCDTHHVTL